jgi:competence protein ComEC
MAKHRFAPQEEAIRTLAWVAFPFGLGALSGGVLSLTWLCFLLGGLLALAGVILGFLHHRLGRRPVLCAAGLAVGLLWYAIFSLLFVAPTAKLAGETRTISATVLEAPTASTYSQRVLVSVPEIGKVYLYSDDLAQCAPGDTLTAVATFQQTSGTSPSAGIYLYATVEDLAQTGTSNALATWPGKAAATLRSGLSKLFSGEVYALYNALLTGDRSSIPTSLSTALSRCGLSHMVAVSGLHMGILSGVLLIFLRRKKQRLLCLPVLLFFTIMVGSVSAWRALLMEILLLLAPVLHREADNLTSLAFALLIILVKNPLAAGSVSLQLSFCSMLGLFLFTGPMYQSIVERCGKFSALPRPLARLCYVVTGGVTTTLGASLLTIPITAWYFRQVSLISILANVLVVWMVLFALTSALCAVVAVLIFPGVASLLSLVPELIGRAILALAHWLGSLTFSALPLSNFYQIGWFLLVQGILLLMILLPQLRRRPILPASCMLLPLVGVILLSRLSLSGTAVTVQALSVGEGQCVLLTAQGETAALDCGGNAYTSAGDTLADALQSQGYGQLDALIITHFDSDHTNGLPELFARVQVKTVYLSAVYTEEDTWRQTLLDLAQAQGTEVVTVEQPTTCALGEGQLTIYPGLDLTGGNNSGLSLLGEFGTFALLSTGDMDLESERVLLARYDLPDIDLLLVGHHGSKYATSERLLSALQPEAALVSVGENRYGHPTAETLWRLSEAGADIYRTDLNGTVTICVTK